MKTLDFYLKMQFFKILFWNYTLNFLQEGITVKTHEYTFSFIMAIFEYSKCVI